MGEGFHWALEVKVSWNKSGPTRRDTGTWVEEPVPTLGVKVKTSL